MPRPQQLQSTTRELDAYQQLTPRTPRTHDRGDGGGHDGDDDGAYASYSQQQTEPLLSSSASDHFPPHSPGQTSQPTRRPQSVKAAIGTGLSRIPLITGILVCLVILILLGLSIRRPDVLESTILGKTGLSNPMGTSHLHTVNASQFISYENYSTFPLDAEDYRIQCENAMGPMMTPHLYWDMDPHHKGPHDVWHAEDPEVCNSTITYQLSGGEVGLFVDLALLAQTVAFALERKRTLFVDDTYWDRGNWTDHFQDIRKLIPGPEPNCKPPPPDELVACPRLARHWVVNAMTSKYHFGHGFEESYHNPYGHELNRLKPVFLRAVDAFRDVIRPNGKNMALLKTARVAMKRAVAGNDKGNGKYMAVHVRRGDRSVESYKYHDKYIPITVYVDEAKKAWKRLEGEDAEESLPIWVASDSPKVIEDWPSERVFSLHAIGDDHILESLATKDEYWQSEFEDLEDEDRVDQTRGVIVDFGMISGMWADPGDIIPEAVVCAMSSVICDMAAVGLGWERAFGLYDGDNSNGEWDDAKRRWIEVENAGNVSPMWMAVRKY